jgi:hypothetical protein
MLHAQWQHHHQEQCIKTAATSSQAYHMLHAQWQHHHQEQCIKTAATSSDASQITPDKIESLIKDFQMHRCTLDFDKGFNDNIIVLLFFVLLILVVIITSLD